MSAPISNITAARPVSRAFLLGASDAESKCGCVPELYYIRLEHKRMYCEGYLSANPLEMAAILTARYYGCEVSL